MKTNMQNDTITIIGIDPGTAIVGYALLSCQFNNNEEITPEILEFGCIRTPKDTRARRLRLIHQAVSSLLTRYTPNVLAVERIFFQKNIRTAMSVGEAQGVIMLAAAQSEMEVVEYTPLQVKEALTGHGRATKDEVQFMIQSIFSLDKPPRPDDAADALAIALCHISYLKLGLTDLIYN